jgi:acyl-CoA hydrolase
VEAGREEDRAMPVTGKEELERFRAQYPDKFLPNEEVFAHVRRGDRIFLGTACGEPQHLVLALTDYVKAHPKAFFDAEIIQVWTLGVAPYTDERLKSNFRLNAFFIGDNTRTAINTGVADYTPIFLSQVPGLFKRRILAVDIALVQTSLPDHHGFLSLGVSVDIVKAAAGSARLIIAQVNPQMPRVQGDGFLHISEVDYVVPFDEPLLEYRPNVPDAIATRIGRYVARIVEDGDTIQVGYGSVPNAIMSALGRKKHLGVHTELLTDGLVDLIRRGVIDNSRKTVDQGKTVTTFCMGSRDTYDFIDGNPTIEFKTIDYTNDPVVIARQEHMCAINSALEVDLTGQATAESIGQIFYSGIGGQADFMRGSLLAPGGKSILAFHSTAKHGALARVVPKLAEGTMITTPRMDTHYLVTEFGAANLKGKSTRDRALAIVELAHPRFREELLRAADDMHLL